MDCKDSRDNRDSRDNGPAHAQCSANPWFWCKRKSVPSRNRRFTAKSSIGFDFLVSGIFFQIVSCRMAPILLKKPIPAQRNRRCHCLESLGQALQFNLGSNGSHADYSRQLRRLSLRLCCMDSEFFCVRLFSKCWKKSSTSPILRGRCLQAELPVFINLRFFISCVLAGLNKYWIGFAVV